MSGVIGMTEFEKLVHRRFTLQKELVAITEFSQVVANGNFNKKQTVEMSSRVFGGDWRNHAIKSAKAADVKLTVIAVSTRSLQEGAEALEKIAFRLNQMQQEALQRVKREATAIALFSILSRYLKTNTYPARELECLEYLIANGDITTPAQLSEYGVT
jgi:hypothetical protein